MEQLEEFARQMLMNQALYRIIEQRGGSIELSLAKVMKSDDMGGISIEVRPDGTCKLTALEPETCAAFQEALSNPDTQRN